MTTGVIVDGKAEREAYRSLFAKLRGVGRVMGPLYADLQPKAPPPQIARKAVNRIQRLRSRGATRFVVLIDHEDRPQCTPSFAVEIEREIRKRGESGVFVAVKEACLENWLVADPDALAALPARFKVTKAFRRSVAEGKADTVADATELLNRIAINRSYHKRHDPPAIFGRMDVSNAARNSRSLRRFLRLMGDRRYSDQSKRP